MDGIRDDDARVVVAIKLDRLFRDAADCLTTTRAWDSAGIALHLVDFDGIAVDTTTAMGRFLLTVTAGFAEMERNFISERTRTCSWSRPSAADPLRS